jgi:monoamine oxidase
MTAAESFDIAIIGAGAAGLAAAAELSASTTGRIALLEGRERVGGRIHTLHDASLPIELGAEFIHGESAAVFEWLRRTNDVAIDATRDRRVLERGKLRPGDDAFERMNERLSAIRRPKQDLPLAEFLALHQRSIPPALRELARSLVEGFDAADATRVSTFDVLAEWQGDAAADAPTFRPSRGYGVLAQAMANSLNSERVQLMLGTTVHDIEWRRGHVLLRATRHGEPLEIDASRAIVTLPLGVLQTPNAVRFDPQLPASHARAIARMGFGPVIKVTLRFAKPFWETVASRDYRDTGFFLAPGSPIPTFWTTLPARSAMLIAWCAGPAAARLASATQDDIVTAIITSLARLFGRGTNYRRLLESVHWHDWQSDPFACGAYSFLLAGAGRARKQLAQPIEDTLFFAGEATDAHGEPASVGGALSTGRRAAHDAIRAKAK